MWTLRSRIIWHRSQKRRILCGRSATTSRGVLEAYSSQQPQSATVRLSMWKGAPNNAEGKAKQCIGVMMSFCSILLRFLNRTFQNAEIRCSVWKQTEAHWNIAAAKRMYWKWSSVRSDCEFGDMKGVSMPAHSPSYFSCQEHRISGRKLALCSCLLRKDCYKQHELSSYVCVQGTFEITWSHDLHVTGQIYMYL